MREPLSSEEAKEQTFESCEEVGHCPKPTVEAAPFHHFYWDSDRDAERFESFGNGESSLAANYGAVVCKTCGLKALVNADAVDFPQI